MKKIGFTTTIPVETILAANAVPVDLNNIFITSENPHKYIEIAEEYGIPRNTCSWIKGIFTSVIKQSVDEVIAVTMGDCSNTHALIELFEDLNIKVHTFGYPYGKVDKIEYLHKEIISLAESIGVQISEVISCYNHLKSLRKKLIQLDELTIEQIVTGFENHLWLVTSTDFNSDINLYTKKLDLFLEEASTRNKENNNIRLGFIGVPSIFSNIYQFIDSKGASVVFNETQRQFSMPYLNNDYFSNFASYTYPYDIYHRLKDINFQINSRKIDGIIHYVQSFCYRQIQDVIVKKNINVPVLTIEGNDPGEIDARTKIRLESFIEMLQAKKGK